MTTDATKLPEPPSEVWVRVFRDQSNTPVGAAFTSDELKDEEQFGFLDRTELVRYVLAAHLDAQAGRTAAPVGEEAISITDRMLLSALIAFNGGEYYKLGLSEYSASFRDSM